MLLLSDYLNPLLSDLFKIIIKEGKIVANQMTCQFLPFNKKKRQIYNYKCLWIFVKYICIECSFD